MDSTICSATQEEYPRATEALKELFEEVYPLARESTIYFEIITGELN